MVNHKRGKKIRSIRPSLLQGQIIDLDLFSGVKSVEKKCRYHTLPGKPYKKRPRESEFAILLNMKQAMKNYYGVREKQFLNYYKKADKLKGSTGDNLLYLLESRLDNVVYRCGYAVTRMQARQMVVHGHVLLNGKRVDRPSYTLKLTDQVSLKPVALKHARVQESIELAKNRVEIEWLESMGKDDVFVVKTLPNIEVLGQFFKVNMVVELFSK